MNFSLLQWSALRNSSVFPNSTDNFFLNGDFMLPSAANFAKCSQALNTYERIKYFLKSCSPLNETERNGMLLVVQEMHKQWIEQARLSNYILVPLLVVYMLMMLLGAAGSGLVISSVVRNRSMRSPRNVFIVNLAISDLTLCLFTEPFNLMRLLYAHMEWVLGEPMCKLVAMFQGTNIFVSTISITAIALDRFQVVLYPTRDTIKALGAVKAILIIWTIGGFLASPLAVFSTVIDDPRLQCTENVHENSVRNSKIAYSICSIILQYILPLFIVIVAYSRICIRVHHRRVTRNSASALQITQFKRVNRSPGDNLDNGSNILESHSLTKLPYPNSPPIENNTQNDMASRKHTLERKREWRTNKLLSSIAIVFATSWLPLNIFNICMDFREQTFTPKTLPDVSLGGAIGESGTNKDIMDIRTIIFIQSLCLLAVLSSACTNPILYGWLNENFRNEFRKILSPITPNFLIRHR